MYNHTLSWTQRGHLWLRLCIRFLMISLGILLIFKLGPPVFSLFAPFILAFICAAILNPIIKWLQRHLGLGRKLLTLVVLIALVGGVGGALVALFYGAGVELVSLAQNWQGLLQTVIDATDGLESMFARFLDLMPPIILESLEQSMASLLSWIQTWVPEMLGNMATSVGQRAIRVPPFLLALLMFVMATFFLTADYPYLRIRAVSHMDESLRNFLSQIKTVALAAFGGYFKAQLLLSIGVFLILLVGFVVTRQSYSLLLAVGLAILDFIPILGSGTVMVPWALWALVTRDYPTAIQVMVIWGIVALFRRVAEPKFVGDQTGLSPILSLVCIYVGMKLAGVAGMILGPILAMVGLNLVGLGLFRGLTEDVICAVWDVAALLRQRTKPDQDGRSS